MNYYWRRVGAYIIDNSVISMFIQIFILFLAPYIRFTGTNLFVDLFMAVTVLFVAVFVSTMYNVLCYKYFKYPLGKLMLNVHILDVDGKRVSVRRYFIREWNKYTYTYATIGVYLIYQFFKNVVQKEQTFHDKQGDTHVYM